MHTISNERPHILFLSDVLYSTAGGAERILSKIVCRLPGHGYRCSIATFSSCADMVDRMSFDCPVHLLPIWRMLDWHAVKTAWRLARLIRSERVSVVHTFFEASDLLGSVVARLSGCPVVISSRRDMGFRRSRAHRIAYRLVAPLYDQVQTVAETVRISHIAQDGLDPRKVVTVHNGVDLEAIDAAAPRRPPELGLPDASPVVVCVGNLRPVKGIEHLVRTAALVCREMPHARFLVIGEAEDRKYLRTVAQQARQLGVDDKVIFPGRRADVAPILKTCDVFHLPSLSEGLSNALLEAMACRLPCVATRAGGTPEVLEDGRSGYLTAVGDAGEAARRILELLADRERAAAMGQAVRGIVETRFSVGFMMNKLVAHYDNLLNPAAAVPRRESAKVCPTTQTGE